jgi:unsaturated chondroitin disaccharide hydrolase
LVLCAALGLVACGGGSRTDKRAPTVRVIPAITLSAGRNVPFTLPRRWAVSFDVRLDRASALAIRIGSAQLGLATRSRGRWQHVEMVSGEVTIDGRRSSFPSGGGRSLTLRARQGRAQLSALIVTDRDDRGALLLHRVAELHARLAPGQFPVGADRSDRLHIDSSYWTSGFWPGALWQAAAISPAPGGAMFARWALAATLQHFGQERSDTHDVGFMYGQSSLAGWEALCGGKSPQSLCPRLKRSVLSAANELVALAASNRRAGTIPTSSRGRQADTIVDSMMNIAILPWASSVARNPVYMHLAARHAHRVASLLVRPDGSTVQAVDFDRATGRVIRLSTHQGISSSSTWSRGQAWAVYGFAQAAAALRDRGLLREALKTARYVERHLPPGGVPRWDYDAPAGAPVDVSAGVITSAGLLHLAAACHSLAGVCDHPARWVDLSRRMLAASLGHAYDHPPLGLLASQVLNERGRGCWCNGGELIFGDTYALEALRR